MNRRVLLLLAMLWSALVLALLASPLALDQTGPAGLLYFPAIVIAVLLSRHPGHVPEVGAIWIGAVVWSLSYWLLILVIYALLLEFKLLRDAAHLLYEGGHEAALADDAPPHAHLARFGEVLGALERRRRRHLLLAAIPDLGLGLPTEMLARAALRNASDHRAVRAMLVHFERALGARNGSQRAATAVARMRAEAAREP